MKGKRVPEPQMIPSSSDKQSRDTLLTGVLLRDKVFDNKRTVSCCLCHASSEDITTYLWMESHGDEASKQIQISLSSIFCYRSLVTLLTHWKHL